MRKRRSFDGFNLAFLDVMSCGLGAIILILMLVKFNASTDIPTEDTQKLQETSAALTQQLAALETQASTLDKSIQQHTVIASLQAKQLKKLQQQESTSQKNLNTKKAVLADVEKSVAAAAPRQANDNIQLTGAGEENYLLGLKVEGKEIAILLDTSASMTDEKLIDIIKRKVGSDREKQRGPKWQRAIRLVQWLLARVPKSSKITLVSFNSSANKIGSQARLSATNSNGLQQALGAIKRLVPQNGTNLQAALDTLRKLNPSVTDIYLVTDGLPTLGKQGKGLAALTQCKSLFGQSKTITGECRARLFVHTVQQSGLRGVSVNTILLPLEGDPQAPQAYWEWAGATGGLMISPAESWP